MSASPSAGPATMRSAEEHLAVVLERARPLEPLDVALLDARGCLLAEEVRAPWPLPPFDSAALLGYAVRSSDLAEATADQPVRLAVVDVVPAGYRASRPVGAMQAIRIGSGAPIPDGADAVIALERTDAGDVMVGVAGSVEPGENIRRAGTELSVGAEVLAVGTRLGSREVALLAAVGQARVRVHPRPRVVVISTGTELVEPGTAITPGLLPDSTGYLLTAAVEEAGGLAYRAGQVADEVPALTEALQDQLVRADLLITTGGVTLSTYDTLQGVLDRLGSVEFGQVAVSPGVAQGYGTIGDEQIPIFVLPGTPTGAFVAFELFVRPVIRRMLGHIDVDPLHTAAVLTRGVRTQPGLRRYLPATLSRSAGGDRRVTPVMGPGLQGLHQANSLLILPEQTEGLSAGDTVSVVRLERR